MWQFTKSNKIKLEYIERIVSFFWKKWQRDYFPTLLVRQKWHVESRNVKFGDIVLLQASNSLKGSWRRGRVITANAGRDGKVWDVTIYCRIRNKVPDIVIVMFWLSVLYIVLLCFYQWKSNVIRNVKNKKWWWGVYC